MPPSNDDVLRFAEDPLASVSIGPDEERISDPRFVVTFSAGGHFWSAAVGRLRFGPDSVISVVEEIRFLAMERGHRASVWLVGDSATPADVVARLTGLGMQPEVTSDVLVLTHPPRRGAATALEVRIVRTLEDHRASIEVGASTFEFPAEDAEDERARAEDSFRAERAGGHASRLLALDRGRPVATGRAWFSPWGLYLGGGATLPTDRGRGAMTTLAAAAWEEAVGRGTPALVVHAGEMSSPILVRLGFEKVGEVVHLIDRPEAARP